MHKDTAEVLQQHLADSQGYATQKNVEGFTNVSGFLTFYSASMSCGTP